MAYRSKDWKMNFSDKFLMQVQWRFQFRFESQTKNRRDIIQQNMKQLQSLINHGKSVMEWGSRLGTTKRNMHIRFE